jgi:hypothetical protein
MVVLVVLMVAVVAVLPNHLLAVAAAWAQFELSGDQVEHSPQLIQVTCNGTLHSYCGWTAI